MKKLPIQETKPEFILAKHSLNFSLSRVVHLPLNFLRPAMFTLFKIFVKPLILVMFFLFFFLPKIHSI